MRVLTELTHHSSLFPWVRFPRLSSGFLGPWKTKTGWNAEMAVHSIYVLIALIRLTSNLGKALSLFGCTPSSIWVVENQSQPGKYMG